MGLGRPRGGLLEADFEAASFGRLSPCTSDHNAANFLRFLC
jgi:hypothetical protein